ncbi:S-layer homology domain-containing protein [Sporosarcina sp. Marseille-Q4943]|uniref:S-layer homology domain-containing protein n=1 Tax=Sporosarcina sp. Marseille-Q4943 TaxID=2942204 RepID=UPI00208DCE68|nr:S-layer homology domain-containing protein [Sporosarcina sp. Marseille-Q4943]
MGNNQPKKYRNFMIGAASAALVATAVAPVASAAQFTDVKEDSTHAPAINALVEAGVINGYTDGTFQPNKTLTRSDVVKMMGKWLVSLGYEVPTDYKTNPRFKDHTSKTNDELLKYAALVKDNGVFNGYPDGTLGAGYDITRENMAIVLVRAYDAIHKTDLVTLVKETEFDKDVTDLAKAKAEARPYIDVLDYFDITNPVAPQFNPKNTTTRGQFASFLYKTSIVELEAEVDTEAPKLVYDGEKTLNVEYGAEFTAPKVTATDNVDEEIEVTSVITNEAGERLTAIDTKVPGTYKVTYSAVDAAGNNAEELVVTVVVAEPANLEVASVEGINATQVEVKFNLPVDKATLFADGKSGEFKANVVSLTSLDNVQPGDLAGELSNDGKTLTITAANVLSKRYDVVIDGLKSYNGKDIVKYEKMVTIAADEKAPTITGTEQISANKVKINFSEPVKAYSGATLKYADGTTVTGASVTVDAGATSVIVDLSSDSVEVNKQITITFIGLQDQAGNLLTPNPATVTVVKQQVDGIKPTVSNVTQTGAKTFNVKFTKDVVLPTTQGVIDVNNLTVSGYDVSKIEKVSDSEYKVTVTTNLDGLQNVTVNAGYKDLAGQTGEAITKVVTFVKDAAAPKATSVKVVNVDGVEYLELNFDKDVTEGDITVSGSYTKDYVTTPVGSKTVAATYASTSNKKVVRTPLNGFASVEGGVYTLDVVSSTVNSLSGIAFDKTSTSFTRGKDVASNKTKLAAPVITQSSNDTVTVTFTGQVDGASATDVANYKVDGAEVESATLGTFDAEANKQVVTLKLKADSNKFTGTRNISVQNVKALGSSVTMDKYIENTVSLTENVRPTVTKAVLTANNEITLTFSENVYDATNEAAADFELYIGENKVTATTLATENVAKDGAKNTLKLTVSGTALTAADIAKGLTVKAASTIDVKDEKDNALNFTSVTVSQ